MQLRPFAIHCRIHICNVNAIHICCRLLLIVGGVFEEGHDVRIAKSVNSGTVAKEAKGRFIGQGEVVAKCGEDTYISRDKKDR